MYARWYMLLVWTKGLIRAVMLTSKDKDDSKACGVCKHYEGHSTCSVKPENFLDYETGKMRTDNVSIYTLRAHRGKCGPEGRLWKAKRFTA